MDRRGPQVRVCADASVALAFLLDEGSKTANALMYELEAGILHVPAHWPTEVLNGLLMSLRRGRMDTETFRNQFAMFQTLNSKATLDMDPDWAEVARIAHQCGLTAYDAAYVELCKRRGATLATLDRRMGAVAHQLSIDIYSM